MTKEEKLYDFEVTITIGIGDISASSEKEARSKLTEEVADYMAETTIEISDKEAKLIDVRDF